MWSGPEEAIAMRTATALVADGMTNGMAGGHLQQCDLRASLESVSEIDDSHDRS